MKINNLGNFLEKVRGGKLALGCCVTFADPAVTEVACAAGFDFVWIDGEHGHMDRNTAMAHMMAVKGTDVASFYRVPACDHTEIKQIIDFAPAGVIVPMVMDAADAATAVAACRYHTEGGNRGCGYRRGWDYGAAPAYGCSYNGFLRFRRFAEMFPQVKDKRWFVTEWRPWSDEDLQLQRIFHDVIWAGMYVQTAFCQKELDGFTMHELNSLTGVFYSSAHAKWNQYYDSWENGRDLMKEAVNEAKKSAPKDVEPYVECCGVEGGKAFMILPDGYPGHPEIKENLPARKVCLEIGKNPKKLAPAALEKAKADGYSVCADEKANRAWLFKSKDVPAEQS